FRPPLRPPGCHALSLHDALPIFVGARLRGLRMRARLLAAEGGTLSSTEVADLLGITRQAVNKRRKAGRLIGLATGRRGYAYPARSEEHTSELQSRENLVRRLLLE